MATANNGGNTALMESAQQSVGEWMKAVKCSTHLLLNQWGVNVDEAWMSLDNNESGNNGDKDSMAKQIVQEQVLKQQRQRSLHFSRMLRHDEESWSCVMSGVNITSMV